ncbi:MAG: hypothetical protein AABX38_05655 [Candidatus Micrarchaeota archaeon]|mgnify:CR=1 FL=1
MQVIEIKPVSFSKVTAILEQRAKDGELGYEQQQALDYVKIVSKFSESETTKILNALLKIGKLNESVAIKLIDIAPKNTNTIKAIALKDKVELSDEEISEIQKILQK